MPAILVRGMVRADKCGKECYDAHEKGVDRCAATFRIGMDETPWVSSYKYLRCVIDEFLDCSRMVEHRVTGFGCMVTEVPRISWRGEWQILSTTVAIFGGICVNVWS